MARTTRLPVSAFDLELVAVAQAGDAEAFDRLVTRYRRLVRSRSRCYFITGADRQDLEQEALIGFYKAVRDFDPELQTSFRAFAELCINRQILTAIKNATRKKHQPLNLSVSFSAGNGGDGADEQGDDGPAVADAQADPAEQLVAMEQLAETHQALRASLSKLEVDVLTRFVEGGSYEGIADDVGRHAKAVDNALQRVKRKLSQHLVNQVAVDALV